MRSEPLFLFLFSSLLPFSLSSLPTSSYRRQLHPAAEGGRGDPGRPQQPQDSRVAAAPAGDKRPDVDAALCVDDPDGLGIAELLAVASLRDAAVALQLGRGGVTGSRREVVGGGDAGRVARGRRRGQKGRRELGGGARRERRRRERAQARERNAAILQHGFDAFCRRRLLEREALLRRGGGRLERGRKKREERTKKVSEKERERSESTRHAIFSVLCQ